MLKLLLLLPFMLFSFTLTARAVERCKQIEKDIKTAHFKYFGLNFPWWYSVAQAEKESLCRHNVFSSDGIGSEGFAQITFRWWKEQLAKEGITEIKSISNHAKAQAFINRFYYQRSECKKLFEMYQMYNGGELVSKELRRAKSCKWEDGKKVCKRKDVCVWVTKEGCKQYRNACDINYEYSVKIFKLGQKYRLFTTDDKEYPFF